MVPFSIDKDMARDMKMMYDEREQCEEARQKKNFAQLIAQNVVCNFLSQSGLLLLTLASTPYIVRSLGDDAYGVLSLAATVVGYLEFLDLGLSTAVEKFVAQYEAQGRQGQIGKLIGTALVIYLLMGLLGASLIGAMSNLLVDRVFDIPLALQDTARTVFLVTGIGFFINMPQVVFRAVPRALQRFAVFNLVNTATRFLQMGVTIVLLYMGLFLVEISVLHIAVSLVTTLAYVKSSKHMLPTVDLRPTFDRSVADSLLRYGAPVSLGKLAVNVATRLDRLFLAIYLPVSSVTYYAVAFSIASKLYLVPQNVVPAVFPALSALQSRGDDREIPDLYVRSIKYIVIATAPLAMLVIALSDDILSLWLGEPFGLRSAWALRTLVLAVVTSCVGYPAVSAANSLGRPAIPATVNVFQAVLSVLLYWILIPRLGVNGAALSWLLPHVLLVPTLIYLVNRRVVKVSSRVVTSKALAKPILFALVVGAVAWISRPLITNLFSLAVLVISAAVLYGAAIFLFAVDSREKRFIRSRMVTVLRHCQLLTGS